MMQPPLDVLNFFKAPLDWFRDLIGEKLRKSTEISLMDEKERRNLCNGLIEIQTEGERTGWARCPSKKLVKQAFNLANKIECNFSEKQLAFLIRRYINYWNLYAAPIETGMLRNNYSSDLELINSDLRKRITEFRKGKKTKNLS